MIKNCVNPACGTEYKLFNSGDLYALERRFADTEFFWLCSECASGFDLHIDTTGCVSRRLRGDRGQAPHPDGTLRLVARALRRIPWRQTIPAGERRVIEDSGEWGGLAHCVRF
jgi:hypothetical protein